MVDPVDGFVDAIVDATAAGATAVMRPAANEAALAISPRRRARNSMLRSISDVLET